MRPRIADLTGGLGVDTLEFSRVAEAVLYNEMLTELAAAAEHNFKVLGAENIEVCGIEASPETLGGDGSREAGRSDDGSRKTKQACIDGGQRTGESEGRAGSLRRRLEEFRPDVIFLDPARRDGCGRKVFLLEDCSPDILKIKDMLLDIAPVLMLKLSPMADISMLLERLGGECRELQVVESGGECKELMVIMQRDGDRDGDRDRDCDRETDAESAAGTIPSAGNGDCLIRVYNLDTVDCGRGGNGDDDGNDGRDDDKDDDNDDVAPVFEFRRDEENSSTGLRLAEPEEIVPGAMLFEPEKALMKAGCFKLIGERLGAPALGRDTHYYILPSSDRDAQGGVNTAAAGKLFRILDVTEMSGKGIRDFAARHPEAEVTARNVRMTSEELRRRLRCKSSDRHHIFALHADRPGRNLLLFTDRIW